MAAMPAKPRMNQYIRTPAMNIMTAKMKKYTSALPRSLRRHDDDAEHDDEVPGELGDGDEAVQVAPRLEIDEVLGQDDDEGQLDYLRGLYAYAEEAEPAVVARALAALAEEYEQDKERGAGRVQPFPVLGEDVEVDDGDDDVGRDAEEDA